MSIRWIHLFLVILAFSCQPSLPEPIAQEMEKLPEQVDFNIHVKPILSDNCFSCHGPDEAAREAGMRLDLPKAAYTATKESGKIPISPGKLKQSEVFHRIISEDPNFQMPTPESHLTLTNRQKAILIKWIQSGAAYRPHWAFITPELPKIPAPKIQNWSMKPIDLFVGQQLFEHGFEPSPPASKELLLRRLSLDITGLPPSLEELDAFLADSSENAYEKQVDRLLKSAHYGEQMALYWMDLARFADTHGYTVDRFRDMSPWRDWVIDAYNQNMPYDQFITEQLAGDQLPNPTKNQKLATAFNRIHPQNMEGGIVQEEFRVEYVADRTNTLGKAFMALSLECARCHDHKFDPISQKEYFQLSSFFNQVDEAGQISWDNAMPVPTMLWTDEQKGNLLKMLKADISQAEKALSAIKIEELAKFEAWINNESYRITRFFNPSQSLLSHFDFDKTPLQDNMNSKVQGIMESNGEKSKQPELVEGYKGKAASLNGDSWLKMGGVGSFSKDQPFSVGIWVNIPSDLENGVIFHTGNGAVLFNRRGYHLYLKDNKLEMILAHTAPYNVISNLTIEGIPRDQWVHLLMTYDGSSKAAGIKTYANGKLMPAEMSRDNLYKDILFNGNNQPGIQVGAVWRGRGLKGAAVDELQIFNKELTPLEILDWLQPEEFAQLISKNPTELSAADKKAFEAFYWHNVSKKYQYQLKVVEKARSEHTAEVEPVQEVMVMEDMDPPRPTYILERGEYAAHGEKVDAGTPESILPMPEDYPKNRLGLAQWLADPKHPLTARVAVNRLWQQFFGKGLVATSSDFGNQGEMPSHPELLDWLAVTFRTSGWDVKKLQKMILMSATYRQSSLAGKDLQEKDPDNTWLARGPSGRMAGEMIRDNALFASSMLGKTIGGPSVKPYQPEGLWSVNGGQYVEDTGENLFRRSLYTLWKRSVPNPTLHIFDAPERSEATIKRQETNTPLQALVLMNDPIYVEIAKVMGMQIASEQDTRKAIQNAFRKLTGRFPKDAELAVLLHLKEAELEKFKKSPEKMAGWLNTGAYLVKENPDQYEWAANTVVASAILNADATITKR
ncbi:DUF1553 domain-containing protein [Cyclobacterium marinum]|uniref:DUF1553 domain-containing protein n=1 Tax=Cyclobacterium marinum TaxID=104 RepID=UPI0011ECDD5C|nr:DUF1553 domain-containing protein [Cyclobacterium marinum]MBI0401074.1 DUF1553 domain-containing protein [Cyclobacterium marinum]